MLVAGIFVYKITRLCWLCEAEEKNCKLPKEAEFMMKESGRGAEANPLSDNSEKKPLIINPRTSTNDYHYLMCIASTVNIKHTTAPPTSNLRNQSYLNHNHLLPSPALSSLQINKDVECVVREGLEKITLNGMLYFTNDIILKLRCF